MPPTSRLPRFYRASIEDRRARLFAEAPQLPAAAKTWLAEGGLATDRAELISENVIGTMGLPLSVALNFTVNGRDVLIAMATEEPSVVAAASNGARLARDHGGFACTADASIMTAQVQLLDVRYPENLARQLAAAREQLIAAGNAAIPRMCERGGGVRDIEVRLLSAPEGMAVVELHVDVGDAMGANTVDTVAEAVAPLCAHIFDAEVGLKILTNLALRRRVRARCALPVHALGAEVCGRIAAASRFAELDIARAATHNKGIMNGVIAAALALGQDTRAIEAGAHAFAARTGGYTPLATWRLLPTSATDPGPRLCGELDMPMATGIVGSPLALDHAAFSLHLMNAQSTQDVACVLAAVGLASNLAALRALADEGIQQGHMRLHHRRG